MRLTNLAIRQSTTVFIMIFIVAVMGLNAYLTLPKEAAPDIQIPVVIVSTPYFGVASKDIETLVTIPIEKKLKELSDVKEITSTSAESASAITIEFEPSVNIDDALQKVREKVDLAKPDLPKDAEESAIIEINFSDQPIMIVNLGSDEGLVKLKKIGEDLQDEIEQIQGILDVDLVGSLEREIKIMVDAERLQYYNLSLNAVINAIQSENINIPGGSIDIGNLKYLVRVPGEFTSMQELRNIVIKNPKNTNEIIYLSDVAAVIDGFKEQNTFARMNGRQSLSLRVKKRAGENILTIADTVKDLAEKYRQKFPNTTFTITADQSQFVRDLFTDMQNNMITSIILVFVVLFFTLGWMNASFVGLAIPLSMLITFTTLQIIDIKLNMVVLFSLIIALGMLVDNSLVIVENAYRLMQEGMGKVEASMKSAEELGFPLISSTLTTLGAFLPLIFWPGIMGEFMGYLPKVLIIALSASLFVAIVINPVFSAMFMKAKRLPKEQLEDDEPKHPLLKGYVSILKTALRYKYLTVLAMGGLFVLTIMAYGQLGAGVIFFAQEDPAVATIDIRLAEGTKVSVTDDIAKKAEDIVNKYAEGNIEFVIANVGSAGSGDGPMGGGGSGSGYSHRASITVDFVDLNKRKESSKVVLEKIRKELQTIVGAKFEIKEQQNGPPTGDPLSVEIIGEDFAILGELTEQVKRLIETVPGVVDLKDNYNTGKPEIEITVDREKASLFKLNTSSIANTVRTAVNGTKASNFRELDEEYDITVRLQEEQRQNLSDIMNLTIANKDDEPVPISMVARVETASGLGSIRRKDAKRTITVSSNVEGRTSAEVVADTKKLLTDKMRMPAGYALNFAGESQDQAEAGAFLSKAFLVAVMLIFMVLVTQFNSMVLPGIILLTVVLSIMGVLVGLMVTQTPFSVVLTGIGVISLAGIVVNNGIVLIDYIQLLRKEGMESFEAVVKAGTVRLRPVLLTATTTILGLFPTALGLNIDFTTFTIGKAGESSQLWFSMAVAIISGLTVSTILTLLFVPCMYLIIENFRDFLHRIGNKIFKRQPEPVAEGPQLILNDAPEEGGEEKELILKP